MSSVASSDLSDLSDDSALFVIDTEPGQVSTALRYEDGIFKPVSTSAPVDGGVPGLFVVESAPAKVKSNLVFRTEAQKRAREEAKKPAREERIRKKAKLNAQRLEEEMKRDKAESRAQYKAAKKRRKALERTVDVESADEDEYDGIRGLEIIGQFPGVFNGKAKDLLKDFEEEPPDSFNPSDAEIQLLQKMETAFEAEEDGAGGRYWGKKSKRDDIACAKCRQKGHIQRDCPNIVCFNCGLLNDHELGQCLMSKKCNRCGLKGHLIGTCPYRDRDPGLEPCRNCPGYPHTSISCALRWRRYVYRSQPEPLPATKGKPPALYCYNCAGDTHLGDDCPLPRGHPVRPIDGTPFTLRPPGTRNVGEIARARRPNIINGINQHLQQQPPPPPSRSRRPQEPVVVDDSEDDLLAGARNRQRQPPPAQRPPLRFNAPPRRVERSPSPRRRSPPPRDSRYDDRYRSDGRVSDRDLDPRLLEDRRDRPWGNRGPPPPQREWDRRDADEKRLHDRYAEPASRRYDGPPPMAFVRGSQQHRPQYHGGYL